MPGRHCFSLEALAYGVRRRSPCAVTWTQSLPHRRGEDLRVVLVLLAGVVHGGDRQLAYRSCAFLLPSDQRAIHPSAWRNCLELRSESQIGATKMAKRVE
jgi:hypothetical protein